MTHITRAFLAAVVLGVLGGCSFYNDEEQAEYDRRVTDWELMRGFERA